MEDVQDVRHALANLAPEEKWQIAERLLEELQQGGISATGREELLSKHLPAYDARRRQIFGNRILPNMVVLGRAKERC